jgi:protein-tyrosine phosphatase
MENVTIDWQNKRMQGHVRGFGPTDGWMDIPLISPVDEKLGLYQGGCMQDVQLGDTFKTVVSLYPWERYARAEGTDLYEIKMLDSSEGVDFDDLLKASNAVLKGLEKGKTLVHCQAGLNRSGLTAAFTLMRLGMPAQDAIDLLRRQRSPMVLCNQTFVNQLHGLEHVRGEMWQEM